MATPKAIRIFVLDDGVSAISHKTRSFFLLDRFGADDTTHSALVSIDWSRPVDDVKLNINLSDLPNELQFIFRNINYENYFELQNALSDYSSIYIAGNKWYRFKEYTNIINIIISKAKLIKP